MSAERDVTRIVRSWLRADEHESADRVLDHVLALVDTTPQHRSPWPVRRFVDMNTYAKLATAAAAVLVVAVLGVLVFPRNSGISSPGPTPTLRPSALPSRSASPSVRASQPPVATEFPADGPLAVGRHSIVRSGVPMSFALTTEGWFSELGVAVDRGPGSGTTPETSALAFWAEANTNVYGDPCKKSPLSPAPAETSVALATAVTKVPLVQVVSAPTAVTIGGFPAQHVAIRIPDSLPCEPHDYLMWYDRDPDNNWRYVTALGMTFDVWIIDHDGSLIWIDGETYKGAAPARRAELQTIIDSIQFE
jgi:hypothetical protein